MPSKDAGRGLWYRTAEKINGEAAAQRLESSFTGN